MKENVKVDTYILNKVRKHIKKSGQTISGFFEVAGKASLSIDTAYYEKIQAKAEKWDALGEKISKFYPEDSEGLDGGDLGDIGEVAAMAYGFL